jgi:hypothetical protein
MGYASMNNGGYIFVSVCSSGDDQDGWPPEEITGRKGPEDPDERTAIIKPPGISGQVHYRCTWYQEFSRQRWIYT